MNTSIAKYLITILAVGMLAAMATAARFYKDGKDAAARWKVADEARTVVAQFFSLPRVEWPSEISPYWIARSTQKFEEAPIRIVEFADPLCSDCRVMFQQLQILKKEFHGRMNIAYQFFPLEAKCNSVVEKDKHPGACDLSYMLAADTMKFVLLHDEIFQNMDMAKTEKWRSDFARKHNVAAAVNDSAIQAIVQRLIATGAEYEKTSDKYSHGIRSTPTMIINNRMLIGTLPLPQMRAILQALLDVSTVKDGKFLENWLEPGCAVDSNPSTAQCASK